MNVKEFAALGGKARAKKLSKKRRSEIARKAGLAAAEARRAESRRRELDHSPNAQ
jgi:hypothetical protein